MNVILIRYDEIFLKGKNRGSFEKKLKDNIVYTLTGLKHKLHTISGRLEISDYDQEQEQAIVNRLTKVFGIYSLSVAERIETSKENICSFCESIKLNNKSFRVSTNRASKIFPIKSMQLNIILGDIIGKNNPNSKVNLTTPEVDVNVDIRENGYTYISTSYIKCVGGMPLGSAGKGLVLLSGGIDSPVATYFLAKRGLTIEAIHFHSYPYTSELARNKVEMLAKKLCAYTNTIKLHIVSVTHIQEEIHKKCDGDFMITLLRRMMMRISQIIAQNNDCGALITGESLGQVASQTLQSIGITNSVVNIPVFRPLIGFDKEEIIAIAQKIDTYETSIMPYEDCCTVFLPKSPVTKPKIEKVLREEEKLDIETLIKKSLESEEIVTISNF
ncbi:MAG: tRNA 4-thiouridine(8) synthase ThiI [Clostridia bacterium]|nr:tRNA 4-thiouridine(8) synthase ThiI [Clostridia bacterium]